MKNKMRFLTSLALIALSSAIFASVGVTLGIVEPETAQGVALGFAFVLFALGMIKGLAGLSSAKGLAYADGLVISDTTYAGEVASQFIVKAITGADTIMGGHVYVKDGIKKKFTIPRFDANYEDFIQDQAATPTSKGEFAITGNVLDPQDYMIYTEFNPRDFEEHWYATQLNATLIDRSLPYTAESVVIQEVLKRHTKYFNKAMWNNDTSLATIYKYWDGFLQKMSDDTDVIDVDTPVTLTKTNVAGEFDRGRALLPLALRYDPNVKIFCSYATYDLYHQYQIEQTYKGIDTTMNAVPTFKGREVVKIADFPDDTFVMCKGSNTPESNLWVGINSTSDEGLQLQRLQANSELWFIKMLMKADCQIGFGDEIVAYNV